MPVGPPLARQCGRALQILDRLVGVALLEHRAPEATVGPGQLGVTVHRVKALGGGWDVAELPKFEK